MSRPSVPLTLALLVVVGSISTLTEASSSLSIEERVRAQEAIERVYHAHRIGAPPFERAVPRGVIEAKVDTVLRLSGALEQLWHVPVTTRALEREMTRIERATRFPERLVAIREALDNDPVLIRETFARASLVQRLARSFFESDERLHSTGEDPPLTFDRWWRGARSEFAPEIRVLEAADPVLIDGTDRSGVPGAPEAVEENTCGFADEWFYGGGVGVPPGRFGATSVWTGTEMIIWGGDDFHTGNTGGRYDPLTDSWMLTSVKGAPSSRSGHTAVWTGTEMIIWGGTDGGTSFDTGGRYDPVTDTWQPTSLENAPPSRQDHAAVWTGDEMIVWGGFPNTGGRYDPRTDTWTPTSVENAPASRLEPLAVWTGSEMIVWGGSLPGGGLVDTGGRYDPETDSWVPTSTVGAPDTRRGQSVVWTGDEMIVWGGGFNVEPPAGGRYDPDTDTWTATTLDGAPENRAAHTAVWTGDRMIVWGGRPHFSQFSLNTGGIYDPVADAWSPTTQTNAPAPRTRHTGVWADTRMIVWGPGASGGRYDPSADSWTPTSTDSPLPSPRIGHTAVWTGSEMIVWGGIGSSPAGARWDPLTGDWLPVSTLGAPSERQYHTAVWTGAEMIVWGGNETGFSDGDVSDGGRYDPALDAWNGISSTGAPTPRSGHTAVWTGSEMIVSGGSASGTPGRYDPATDAWTPTSATGAPTTVYSKAVWTGSEMIVWGGCCLVTNTGARYDPATDLWTPTSTLGAPDGRVFHAVVWTGDEMIVWGGLTPAPFFGTPSINHDTGGRYDPVHDTWAPTTLQDAPQGRFEHTLIWTGAAMIPWGGAFYSGDVRLRALQRHVAWYGGGPLPPSDADGDGYTPCDGDCDDTDAAVHPGAVDYPGDALDDDCAEGPLCDPEAPWKNRGAFVACVARECHRLVAEGSVGIGECSAMLTETQRDGSRRSLRP